MTPQDNTATAAPQWKPLPTEMQPSPTAKVVVAGGDPFGLNPEADNQEQAAWQAKAMAAAEPDIFALRPGHVFEVVSPFQRFARIIQIANEHVLAECWSETYQERWVVQDGKSVDVPKPITKRWRESWGMKTYQVWHPEFNRPEGGRGAALAERHLVVVGDTRSQAEQSTSRLVPQVRFDALTNQPLPDEAYAWQPIKLVFVGEIVSKIVSFAEPVPVIDPAAAPPPAVAVPAPAPEKSQATINRAENMRRVNEARRAKNQQPATPGNKTSQEEKPNAV